MTGMDGFACGPVETALFIAVCVFCAVAWGVAFKDVLTLLDLLAEGRRLRQRLR